MKAASFSRCVHYVTGKEDAKILVSDGVLLTTIQDIIDSFEFQRQMNPRISKPVGHIALSFLPEDKDILTDEMMTKIVREYMELMGFKDTQFSLCATSTMAIPTAIWSIIVSTTRARPSLTRTILGGMNRSRNFLSGSMD